jgi:hypothetical protein
MPRPVVDDDGMMPTAPASCTAMKPRCYPNTHARKIPRSIHEGARDMARALPHQRVFTSRRQRKKVEMLFAT